MIVEQLKKLRQKSLEQIEVLKEQLRNPDLTRNVRRSVAAKILGISRRYKRDVMVEVTMWALEVDGSQASKHKVGLWQTATFGHTTSNATLTTWCESQRGCGQRADFELEKETTERAKELYDLFESLKHDVDESRLLNLTGRIFGKDLGL